MLFLGFICSFKPCYKWITFNTCTKLSADVTPSSFKPCYKWITFNTKINHLLMEELCQSFKPCYKWITFNTYDLINTMWLLNSVLNLVINGLPSILS